MIGNVILFLIGALVYASYGWSGFAYMIGAILVSWGAGRLTKRFPWVAWVGILFNVLSLLALKLSPVTGIEWVSALGASYISLQLISYNADVLKGKYPAETNLFRYALFATWLPHVYLGPIERYDAMRPQLLRSRKPTWDGISRGAARVVWGLFKKLVIAARLGVIVSAISAEPEKYNGAFALAAMLLYSLQLYSDFSGGIDMVLGVSQMLDVSMQENFEMPYFSQSIQEFWRRWHMSLGSWLREYVYIPLGGNRKGNVRKIINTVVTFLVSGLWHGVHYVLWGLLNGVFVCFGERLKTRFKTLNRIGVFLLISALWAFFVWPDTKTALDMLGSVFCNVNYLQFAESIGTMGLTAGDWIVLAGGLGLLWRYDLKAKRSAELFHRWSPAARVAIICGLGLLVLVFGMYGIGFEAGDFIYSQF